MQVFNRHVSARGVTMFGMETILIPGSIVLGDSPAAGREVVSTGEIGSGTTFWICGLPSIRATSGRPANVCAISRVPFTRIAFTM